MMLSLRDYHCYGLDNLVVMPLPRLLVPARAARASIYLRRDTVHREIKTCA